MSEVKQPRPDIVTGGNEDASPQSETAMTVIPCPESSSLVPVGEEDSLAEITSIDELEARLEVGSMELVGRLFAIASGTTEHTPEQKKAVLAEVITLLKKMEVEGRVRGNPKKATIIQRLFAFIPRVQEQIRLLEGEERRSTRLFEARKDLVVGAKQLADELGIDVSVAVPELHRDKQEERMAQLEGYMSKISTYLRDPHIRAGVLAYAWDGIMGSIGDNKIGQHGFTVREAVKSGMLAPSAEKQNIENELRMMLFRVGISNPQINVEGIKVSFFDNKRFYVAYWDISNFTRLLLEQQGEYTTELFRLRYPNGDQT